MNAAATSSRPLQILAGALAAAIAVLFVAWVRQEPLPTPPDTPSPEAHDIAAAPAPASTHRDAAGATDAARIESRSDAPRASSAATAVLFGTVKRTDGTLVNDGFCWLYREGKLVGSESLRLGTFAFPGLQPGPHRLTSRIPDELAIDREVIVQAPQTRLDVELAAKWLLTVNAVTPEGKALREASPELAGLAQRNLRALAFPEPLAGDLVGSRSSEFEAGLGPFRANDPFSGRDQAKLLPKETLGVLTLPPDKPVHVALLLGGTLIAQQPATPGQERVEFVLAADAVTGKTCTVTFRCLDPNGAPVSDARVSMSSGSGMSSGPKMMTDAEGRYTATKVLPGRVGFSVWHKELRMPPLETEVAPGAYVDLGDLAMRPAGEFEISFAGSGGKGTVYAYWLDAPRNARWRATDSWFSEENAPVAKASLYPGRYALFARGKNGVALLEIDTAALPREPLRLPWAAGARLQIDNKIGTGFLQLEIASARGLPVHRTELGSRMGYSFELPPGDYVATMRSSTGTTTKPFHLPAAGATLTVP